MILINESNQPQSVKSLIALLLVLVIIGTTLLSLVSYVGWNIVLELSSHFQVQYLMINLLLLGLLCFTRRKSLIIICFFCVAIIMTQIVPWYIPQARVGGNTTGNFRVLISNVHAQNKSYSKILSLVRKEKPDLAVFIEVSPPWVKQLESLEDILPHSTGLAMPYNLGITVLSQVPLSNTSINFFGTRDKTIKFKKASILGDLAINGQVISLIATHPATPVNPVVFQSRNKQLDEISKYVQHLKTPVLMVGDLNTTMWSPYYRRFVNKTGLRNARLGFGILPTWPTKNTFSRIPPALSGLLSIPIDHCLVSPEIKVANISTGPNIGSDHLPLIIDLRIPPKK